MVAIEIYDPAMCCSTGVCGVNGTSCLDAPASGKHW
ncbi:MAG: arsenic metallochaperone ArsD family protein [Nitrospira sp.]